MRRGFTLLSGVEGFVDAYLAHLAWPVYQSHNLQALLASIPQWRGSHFPPVRGQMSPLHYFRGLFAATANRNAFPFREEYPRVLYCRGATSRGATSAYVFIATAALLPVAY